MFVKLVATLALHDPDFLPPQLCEAVLGQNTVCPSQLKEVFHQGVKDLRMPVDLADNADSVYGYMSEVLDVDGWLNS